MKCRSKTLIRFLLRSPASSTLSSTTKRNFSSKIVFNTSVSSSFSTSQNDAEEVKEVPETFDKEIETKKMILEAALLHAPQLGWKQAAIVAGASDLGHPSVTAGLFPRGPIELVEYAMLKWNAQLREDLVNTEGFDKMNPIQRVRLGLKLRLSYKIPYIATWPEAMSLGALPPNTINTTKCIADFCDEIWFRAGDRSSDLSWFTKRGALGAIYISTELHMLTDKSPDFEATWKILDSRIQAALAAASFVGESASIISAIGGGLGTIVSSTQGAGYVPKETFADLKKKYKAEK